MDPADHRSLSWLALALAAAVVIGPGVRLWTGHVAGPFALFALLVVASFALARAGPR
jgi:hypothetical protein